MNKYIASVVTIFFLIGTTACDDFFDVNESPNNPLVAPPEVLLPSGLAGTAFAYANELNRFTTVVVQHLAGAGGSPAAYDVYNIDGSDFNNQWEFEIYGGALVNYRKCIEAAEETQSNAYIGISKIMQAYTFAITTDFWGDIPYSEALQGDIGVIQPNLDTQEDIYLGNEGAGVQSLFDLVKEGLQALENPGEPLPGVDDLAYGGDIELWQRAGYTLLLKLAMQLSEVDPQRAQQEIQNVVNLGEVYMNDNSHDLNITFGGNVGSQSPVHTYTNVSLFQNELILSERYLDFLEDRNDPRLPIFFTSPTGEYVTLDNGATTTLPPPDSFSQFNNYVTGQNGEGPVRILTHFQTKFILAEAALIYGITEAGTPQELYQQGIRASMALAGVAEADIDAYFTANPTVVTLAGTAEEQREQIITQKYIAFTGYGYEPYNDWRRTGYPVLSVSQNAVGVDGTIPLRVVYTSQSIANNANIPPQPPQPNVPVWWDVE